jgi:predicted ester cyclase
MSANEHKELVRYWYEDVLSGPVTSRARKSPDGTSVTDVDMSRIFTASYTNHVTPAPPEGWKTGLDAARQIVRVYRLSFPDLAVQVQQQLVVDDMVVTHYTAAGTHIAKPFFGLAASGKNYKISGLGMERIVNGKIAESWGSWDTYTLMQQMGILPASAMLVG